MPYLKMMNDMIVSFIMPVLNGHILQTVLLDNASQSRTSTVL